MKHLAVIMDGNGRWAVSRGQERSYGYRYGAEAFVRLLEDFLSMPLSVLTVYAFSTENNNRNNEEVSNIYSVIASFLLNKVNPFCVRNEIKLRFIGDIDNLPDNIKTAVNLSKREEGTKTVVIALNYGGIDEVTRAVNNLIENKKKITQDELISSLDTVGLPLPDAILRYGGYKRLSNFLPLQSTYSELFFTDKLWPDYDKEDILSLIEEYKSIKRNFGGNHA